MKIELRQMIMIGIFAALMVVGAQISIPTPLGVPITFQLFFSIYAGLLLGAKAGLLSQIIYILLGLIGLPVFSKGTGGIGVIFSQSFGYIIGFAIASLIVGLTVERLSKVNFINLLFAAILGFAAIYIIGNTYMYFIKDLYIKTPVSYISIYTAMVPFMIKDFVLICVAAYSSTIMIPILRKSGMIKNTVILEK